MKVLVTGASGFVGKNLCEALKNIRDGKDKTRPELIIEEIYEYDIQTDPVKLNDFCKDCDFVFNLAGVNRPKNEEEFMKGNFGFASTLLDTLKAMNFAEIQEQGFIPLYKREAITDDLHEACGFQTDYQFITKSRMKTIQKKSKRKE